MPPRIDLADAFSSLRIQSTSKRLFSTTSPQSASTVAQKRRHQDPYALAQARARRAANLSRQEVLRTERSKAFGDPIRGIPTPFTQSFNTTISSPVTPHPADPTSTSTSAGTSTGTTPTGPATSDGHHLNHFLTSPFLSASLARSESLSAPQPSLHQHSSDPQKEANEAKAHREGNATAAEALRRITSLGNASSKDRVRANVQRCVDTFGRHVTDGVLRAKPESTSPGMPAAGGEALVGSEGVTEGKISHKTPRAGPDTGSSEVQIAILTSKINVLADFLETRGRKDKVNARNLRLLVHRRQKLLRYLRKRERGGERWRFLIEKLGLTEATWKGEISM